eukprot:3645838-Prymnesium_polylepis.1
MIVREDAIVVSHLDLDVVAGHDRASVDAVVPRDRLAGLVRRRPLAYAAGAGADGDLGICDAITGQ